MEDIIIVSIVFGSVLAAFYLILDHLRSRRASSASDRSLTASELSDLIDEAVDRSTAELRRRIENLEAIAVDEPVAGERLRLEEQDERESIQIPARESQRSRT